MTGATLQPVILLLDKLMTITNLNILVPVKLDIDEINYSSWMYVFMNLCNEHELTEHILGKSTDTTSSSDPSPPTSEWLVVENPQTAMEAWDILAEIFNDNKLSWSVALKAELRSLKLDDLSIDAYFRKIESIARILASLGSPISKDDIVNIALEWCLSV
ncbi:hypothetical protein Tco_0774639 [Tanacetum coccineum]|uniref:Hybrid signal transduction histidine kinase M n=1 Tax=Tanacetum coccineum TaxID=301880 RepID=A0ABQ4ZTB8_9ASTR